MVYDYLLEHTLVNNHVLANKISLLCYHINNTSQYPFLQFILELNNKILDFPNITINDSAKFKILLECKINNILSSLGNDVYESSMYTGILNIQEKMYICVNISTSSIFKIKWDSSTVYFPVLTSEIINHNKCRDNHIASHIVELFAHIPTIGLLHSLGDNSHTFIIPDPVYSENTNNKTILDATIGPEKYKISNESDTYFYCFQKRSDVIRDMGGVVRYALFFVSWQIYSECNKIITIDNARCEQCKDIDVIVIHYEKILHDTMQDILVTNYDHFIPLSYELLE